MQDDDLARGLSIDPYIVCLIVGIALGVGLLLLRVRRNRRDLKTVMLFALLGMFLGLVCAKLFYSLARFSYLYGVFGVEGLLRFKIGEFAFTGAILGVLAAAGITAGVTRQKFAAVLDLVAPEAILIAGLARFSEYFTQFGVGEYVANTNLQFFPFALPNEYEEWYAAIFMLEGLVALIAFLVLSSKKFPQNIHKGEMALILFALSQVFLESLRTETIKWGFVRVQQLSSVIIACAVFAYNAYRLRRLGAPLRGLLIRAGVMVLGIGVCIGVEFALDKTDIPRTVSYMAMVAVLIVMGVMTVRLMQKRGLAEATVTRGE